MKRLISVAALLIASQLALAAPKGPVGPMMRVEVTNEQNNPVPVTVTNQNSEQLFVYEKTVSFSSGDNRASRELFTVPSGKTLIIEYISGFNAGIEVESDGQETSLHISYNSSGTGLGDFPGANIMFESKSNVQDLGGAKVFLPVPGGSVVKASLQVRDAPEFFMSYRVTVAGRLVDTPVQGPFD